MAKNDQVDTQQPAVVDPTVEQVTLEEFCLRLSNSDRRVELIGAFHFVEKQASRFKDAESNYASRFSAFVNKPV